MSQKGAVGRILIDCGEGVGDRFIIGWSLQRLLRIHKLQSCLLSGLIYRTPESVQGYCVVSFSADI